MNMYKYLIEYLDIYELFYSYIFYNIELNNLYNSIYAL